MASNQYELRLEAERGHIREVSLYGVDSDGQLRYVAAETFGPFDTHLEVAQWAWKWLTLDLASPTG